MSSIHCRKEQQVREAEAEAERIQRGMETRLNELVSGTTATGPSEPVLCQLAFNIVPLESECINDWTKTG